MSTRAAELLGLPPGIHFHPDDAELIELFLLPRSRDEPPCFPGVVIEDDSAANTHPCKLFKRHGRDGDDEAYFFVHTKTKDAKVRPCDGGGTWTSQRTVSSDACIRGEKIRWSRHNLNLHMAKRSGSTGWVMHEYTITQPPCPSLRICHVAFTGHGQKRKRVPDQDDEAADCQSQAAEPAARRVRFDAAVAAANSGSSTCVYGLTSSPALVSLDAESVAAHASACDVVPLHHAMAQETGAEEQQNGGDYNEQMEFWNSIRVDIDNIV